MLPKVNQEIFPKNNREIDFFSHCFFFLLLLFKFAGIIISSCCASYCQYDKPFKFHSVALMFAELAEQDELMSFPLCGLI